MEENIILNELNKINDEISDVKDKICKLYFLSSLPLHNKKVLIQLFITYKNAS